MTARRLIDGRAICSPSGAKAIKAWHDRKFPDKADDRLLSNKLAEEAGEVCGATTKIAEGRKGLTDLADEMGDLLVCLSVLAGRHGWSLAGLLQQRFEAIASRPGITINNTDNTNNKENG